MARLVRIGAAAVLALGAATSASAGDKATPREVAPNEAVESLRRLGPPGAPAPIQPKILDPRAPNARLRNHYRFDPRYRFKRYHGARKFLRQ